MTSAFEGLLRSLVPQALGVLVRRHGQTAFGECEDAVQEAVLDALVQWPDRGVPDNPHGWLLTVASRRLVDHWRSDAARRRREEAAYVDSSLAVAEPSTLTLLFMCCHPSLSPSSQIALTLRAVGGLTTAEIARAFLVPEATMAQRISRAKQSVRHADFDSLPLLERLRVVLHVLYLIFNEGYTSLSRVDLTAEAIRLTRLLHSVLPADLSDGEVAGLLALMLLTDARRPARTSASGGLVPLSEQDRGRWDAAFIAEGIALIESTLASSVPGPYQIQAAIAAVHDSALSAADTDWPQILALYKVLDHLAPSPIVTLNQAVAVAMVHGPLAGLALLDEVAAQLSEHHRLHAVRAHLLEMAGDLEAARAAYQLAARRTTSLPEQRYLEARAARL